MRGRGVKKWAFRPLAAHPPGTRRRSGMHRPARGPAGDRHRAPAAWQAPVVAVALSALVLSTALSVPASTAVAATSSQAGSSLVIEVKPEARLADDFNPFDLANPLTQMGAPSYVYEPLLQYDQLQVDQYYPWLASSWAFSSSGQTITFDLRPGVKWQDGRPLTASDVAYTFDLLKADPSLDAALTGGIPIVSAQAAGPSTFVLTLSQPGYSSLSAISRAPIVRDGYAAGSDPTTYVDRNPDGTGPYYLARPSDATPSRVVLTARSGYWQTGEPAIDRLVFPAYRDAAAVLAALQSGALDWSALPLARVRTDFVRRDQADDHFWFPAVGCISLGLNLATYPANQLPVRRAISAAIDRSALSSQVEGGFAKPAKSSSGLVLPMDGQFLPPSLSADIEDAGDPALAARMMLRAGYRLGAGGYWEDHAGKSLALAIEAPAGSPFASMAAVLSQQLQAAGFDATARLVTRARWEADLAAGNFEASVLPSTPGPSPFYMYEEWLDPALLSGGRASGGDFVRVDDQTAPSLASAVTQELAAYRASLSGSPAGSRAVEALARTVAAYLPVVPLLYGVAWGEWSTRNATGWPGAGDPYEPPTPLPPFAEYTVLQLTPSSG
jgi:peptide/nickel transport system substrate-binding protein